MSVTQLPTEDTNLEPKRARIEIQLVLGFSDQDKIRTIQLHDDVLVVTLKIGGYDVRRVLVDQGSGAKIMHPGLYKGPNILRFPSGKFQWEGCHYEGYDKTTRAS